MADENTRKKRKTFQDIPSSSRKSLTKKMADENICKMRKTSQDFPSFSMKSLTMNMADKSSRIDRKTSQDFPSSSMKSLTKKMADENSRKTTASGASPRETGNKSNPFIHLYNIYNPSGVKLEKTDSEMQADEELNEFILVQKNFLNSYGRNQDIILNLLMQQREMLKQQVEWQRQEKEFVRQRLALQQQQTELEYQYLGIHQRLLDHMNTDK